MDFTAIIITILIFIIMLFFLKRNDSKNSIISKKEDVKLIDEEDFQEALKLIIPFRDLITNSNSPEDEKTLKSDFRTAMITMRSETPTKGLLSDLKRNSYNALVKFGRGEIAEEELKEIFKEQEPLLNFYFPEIKNNIKEYKHQINLFLNEMKKMPDWYEIIQARGNGHAMFAKTMNIKVDDYEYWANAHKEEYMLKYNDGNLDVEGINLRIEKFGFIVAELEKVIKKAAELNLNITHEMHNDYCAARASVLGAEYALKEMTK